MVKNSFKNVLLSLVLGLFFGFSHLHAARPVIFSTYDRHHPVTHTRGMVVTQEKIASRIGLDILRRGGNAVDAAVAVGFALAVSAPQAGNLGGGGFMLVYIKNEGRVIAIDYRERAPKKAYEKMFLDLYGKPDPHLSRYSAKAAGVPGTVYGLTLALEKYGTMELKDVMEPAIKLAEEGIIVTQALHKSFVQAHEKMKSHPASIANYYPNKRPPRPGERLIQTDLGSTLRYIARKGRDGFYKGKIASEINKYMRKNDGLITKADLASYRAVIREPIHGSYKGYDIYAMPPPSSGGVHLIQILNILEEYDFKRSGHNSAKSIHIMAEAMKYAYADRSKYLGDPDFVDVPVQELTSKVYARDIRTLINPVKAAPSEFIAPGVLTPYESNETTHYSIMDKFGNMVSNTYTLNFSFGSKITIPKTGILMNNQMDDFSAKAGSMNAYGLLGGTKNKIEPNKRMLSSMTPTIILKDKEAFMATGSPGGSRIITTVLQVIMNVIDHNMNIAEATHAPRIHHQWFPEYIRIEDGISPDSISLLRKRGHVVKRGRAMGAVQSIMVRRGQILGSSDPRRADGMAIGY